MSGIYSPFTNIATWYLSSMIICMIILYPLLRKYKYNFLYIVAPILVLLIYGYLSNNNIHLKSAKKWIGFTYIGNLRAFADLTLGCLIYPLVEKIKKIKFTKFGSLVITIIELVCFIGTICICHFVFKAVKFVYISILLLTIGITLAFSEKTLDYKIMCNKFNYWLEKLSLPVYIFHLCIREFIQYAPFMPKLSYKITILIYISSAIIFGIIMMYIHDFFKKKKVGTKVLKLVIEK
jgi:hypothetical protein